MTAERKKLITILGSTATGKTRLAVAVARSMNGEVISADSRQVYRGMDIGTGKDLCEYGGGDMFVPYHLIDILDPGDDFNLFDFQREFVSSYGRVSDEGKIAILCGGTGLYIDSILRRYKLADVPVDPVLRRELDVMTDSELISRLTSLKSLHNTTDTLDRQRLVRAIEIAEYQSIEAESIVPQLECYTFGLRTDRTVLKERITARLKIRIEQGLVEEVEDLLKAHKAEQLEYYGLEYRLVTAYVLGRINRNDMYQKLKSEIYQFAKRQEKWFRKMERNGIEITWFNAEDAVASMVDAISRATVCRPYF